MGTPIDKSLTGSVPILRSNGQLTLAIGALTCPIGRLILDDMTDLRRLPKFIAILKHKQSERRSLRRSYSNSWWSVNQFTRKRDARRSPNHCQATREAAPTLGQVLPQGLEHEARQNSDFFSIRFTGFKELRKITKSTGSEGKQVASTAAKKFPNEVANVVNVVQSNTAALTCAALTTSKQKSSSTPEVV